MFEFGSRSDSGAAAEGSPPSWFWGLCVRMVWRSRRVSVPPCGVAADSLLTTIGISHRAAASVVLPRWAGPDGLAASCIGRRQRGGGCYPDDVQLSCTSRVCLRVYESSDTHQALLRRRRLCCCCCCCAACTARPSAHRRGGRTSPIDYSDPNHAHVLSRTNVQGPRWQEAATLGRFLACLL